MKPIQISKPECYVIMPLRSIVKDIKRAWKKFSNWFKKEIFGFWWCELCGKYHPPHVVAFTWKHNEEEFSCSEGIKILFDYLVAAGRAPEMDEVTPTLRGEKIPYHWDIACRLSNIKEAAERRDTP